MLLPTRPARRLLLALALLPLLTGCFSEDLPTQSNPTCSWSSSPPANSDALCRSAFTTIRGLAEASKRGDNAAIHRLVADQQAAGRIIRYSRQIRQDKVLWLHAVPSFTLRQTPDGYLGAGFYLLGKTERDRIKAPQTLVLRVRAGKAVVVADQGGQEW
jgi:hypothetical protein